MPQPTSEPTHLGIVVIRAMLRKVDSLCLPTASRRVVERILVRQVSDQLDRALPWQAGHGCRTAKTALMIGRTVGLPADQLHDLELAALLHDIGLLMLPAHLIKFHGHLEPESYIVVQNHPRLGSALLEPFSFLRKAAILVAHHHERWDGSGYPYGIRGQFIPLVARILSIADAFDAIRIPNLLDPFTRNKIALRIIRVAAGTQFDPELVETFCQLEKPTSDSAYTELVVRNYFDSR